MDAAQPRLHERRVWEVVQETAAPVRAEMEKAHRAEWAELLGRQERVERQPPGWEDSPELAAEVEQLGGLSYHGQASFDAHQREARLARQAGRPPPDLGRDRGGFER